MSPTRHVTRCLIAGLVALLPLGGAIVSIAWLEGAIAGQWRSNPDNFYFPGLGLLLAFAAIYVVGLFVTTFVGRWLWRSVDRLIEGLPVVGSLYTSLKEVLGYDSAKARFFQGVVAVRVHDGFELGLVTGEAKGPGGTMHKLVFMPSSPNPANGRLVLLAPDRLVALDVRTADALRTLVSIGKTSLDSKA